MIYEYKIESDFIFPEAVEPDPMQIKNDTIFTVVVSNIPDGETKKYEDWFASTFLDFHCCQCVDFRGKSASYTRADPVLSFFGNRIDDFFKMYMAREWLVHRPEIENRLDIFAKAEEEINFEY